MIHRVKILCKWVIWYVVLFGRTLGGSGLHPNILERSNIETNRGIVLHPPPPPTHTHPPPQKINVAW